MARSAAAAGYEVVVYAVWAPGLPATDEVDGIRVVRAPSDWRLAIPGLRGAARRRASVAMGATARPPVPGSAWDDDVDAETASEPTRATNRLPHGRLIEALASRSLRRLLRPPRRWWRLATQFPLRPMAWASALDDVAEPAQIWHGMWAGSLPALVRLRRSHGGKAIYDSRDVYMRSRDFARLGWPARAILAGLERRWAQAVDRVVTVNEPYAALLVQQLRIPRPTVILNCPETWNPPDPPPDLIRQALGLSPETSVALYQGRLNPERGIEQAMDAILLVPGAILALLGFGHGLERFRESTAKAPYRGRVLLLPPVPPGDLLAWTASADVSIMAIQPTTLNHRYSTPQKLFESLAAGVPVVAADLPGMTDIVRTTGVGVVCDPTSPRAIADAILEIIAAPVAERGALRAHVLRVAHERYNWEGQVGTLMAVYQDLLRSGLGALDAGAG